MLQKDSLEACIKAKKLRVRKLQAALCVANSRLRRLGGRLDDAKKTLRRHEIVMISRNLAQTSEEEEDWSIRRRWELAPDMGDDVEYISQVDTEDESSDEGEDEDHASMQTGGGNAAGSLAH